MDAYLQTIGKIENSDAQMIIGCHWPMLPSKEEIRQFCDESRNFVALADRLITNHLRNHPSGATLRELCEQLSDQLGEWPKGVSLELANAFSGHMDRGVESRSFEVDPSACPFRYRLRGAG